MRLKEYQKKLDKALEKLVAEGQLRKMEDSVKEYDSKKKNTSEDKQVSIGAIFMPPRINRREKWLKEKRLRDEENNNDSQ